MQRFQKVLWALIAIPGIDFAPAQSIVIQEIMYHPVGSVVEPVDGEMYEFLELYNASDALVNLSGARFVNGLSYTFPDSFTLSPSSCVALVKNEAAFTSRYPGVTNYVGPYAGSLANAGERITLESSGGTEWFSVRYEDSGRWPYQADGYGCSLVFKNSMGDPDDPENWCASDWFLGTPGETGGCRIEQVTVNEVLAHTDLPALDAIELYNTSSDAVDLTGWYLSDDAVLRKKYRIPDGTILDAGAYRVFTENEFGLSANPPNVSFRLSELGDEVYLTAADAASNLTRMVDAVSFEASDNGVSFGRYPNGTGVWTTMESDTLGAFNSLPKVGPLVIAEVMYHPPNDNPEEEYIELLNVTSNSLFLYDFSFPSNTWKLTSGVEYSFPSNISVAAGERILVTGATNLSLFRQTYGLAETVQVWGPWQGRLNNAGERIQLYKPGSPEIDRVPYILVDQLDYLDSLPWAPAADGNGSSLERISETSFGNTSGNWLAGLPGGSPGAASPGGFIDPLLEPSVPVPLQPFTVRVSFVNAELPTQVVVRLSVDEIESTVVMTDDGTGADVNAGDLQYAAQVPGQADGSWVYYQFIATFSNSVPVTAPVSRVEYYDSPELTVRMSGNGLRKTVQPTAQWEAYSYSGLVSHSNIFFMYLEGAGQALVDDMSVQVGGVERIPNGSFSAPLEGSWRLGGNHDASYRDELASESSNGVMHIVTELSGTGSGDNVNTRFDPPAVIGEEGHVSFRTRLASFEQEAWFSLLIGTAPPEVMIHELMYHPVQTNETDFEYIELYNAGNATTDLSGWKLDGVGFFFPSNTQLAAGGYLVCCASTSTIQQTYGISSVVGNWPGRLKNSGERVQLINRFGRIVDEVDYEDHFPWPVTPDGYGPSLERVGIGGGDPEWLQWASSTAPTHWQTLVWTQQVSGTSSSLKLWLDFEGKCLLDNVQVVLEGDTSNRVSNGNFEAGLTSWAPMGNHDQSRVETSLGQNTSSAMVVVGNYTRLETNNTLVVFYGDAPTHSIHSAPFPTVPGSNHVVRVNVKRSGLGKTLFVELDGFAHSFDLSRNGSPGESNSVAMIWHPGVESLEQEYAICPVNTANVIRASVVLTSLVSSVQLRYRTVATNAYEFSDGHYIILAMTDDGVPPDPLAGDGEFTASIPGISNDWTLVRYHVRVLSTNGMVQTYPHPDDPGRDYGYWVQTTSVQSYLPNWHLLVDGAPVLYPNSKRVCAVSPDGQVFTDARLRHRGNTLDSNETSAVALRFNRAHEYDAWFADDQEGINFRHRGNDSASKYQRVLQEPISYDLANLLGYPVPRLRHTCLWINGRPTITTELESPGEDYLIGNGISLDDFVSRRTRSGRVTVGGDPSLDNFSETMSLLNAVSNETKEAVLRTHADYESIRYTMGFISMIGSADHNFRGNMFAHRSAKDLRWRQYPWDLNQTFLASYTNLHPYYQTLDHPSIFHPLVARPFSQTLFYPEAGPEAEYTRPYRYRHQMTLWRYTYTVLTTNWLYPKIESVLNHVEPSYQEIGVDTVHLSNKVVQMKTFLDDRRSFYIHGTWSDKDSFIWNPAHVYDPTQVVINEIMYDPVVGGEYLELYNAGTQTVDLSWWALVSGEESYHLPHGTMMGPTSYLVIADTQSLLTNAFQELSDSTHMVQRNTGVPLWDESIVWTTATEYATRVVQIPSLTLPNEGGQVALYDVMSNEIDRLAYSPFSPWPSAAGISLERINPNQTSSTSSSWRLSTVVGTPGHLNSATFDQDEDAMADSWEAQIISASGGSLTNIEAVLSGGDFDLDGVDNGEEFVLGLNPVVMDREKASLTIREENGEVVVEFPSVLPTGSAYQIFSDRLYTLEWTDDLPTFHSWSTVTGYVGRSATGGLIRYSNGGDQSPSSFRYNASLKLMR